MWPYGCGTSSARGRLVRSRVSTRSARRIGFTEARGLLTRAPGGIIRRAMRAPSSTRHLGSSRKRRTNSVAAVADGVNEASGLRGGPDASFTRLAQYRGPRRRWPPRTGVRRADGWAAVGADLKPRMGTSGKRRESQCLGGRSEAWRPAPRSTSEVGRRPGGQPLKYLRGRSKAWRPALEVPQG